MATGFDRDFGYLLPFLDRVTRAASDHPDAQVRAELSGLLADEKARWTRVRDLLAARPGVARVASAPTLEATEDARLAPAPPPSASRAAKQNGAVTAATLGEREAFPKVLTVGPLRNG